MRLLLALTAFAVLSVLAIAAPARADSVTNWDQIAAAALQSPGTATPPGAGQGAPSIVHLAMVHAAVYDAVNAIDGGHDAVRLLARGRARVLAGRRRRGRRTPRARLRRAGNPGRTRGHHQRRIRGRDRRHPARSAEGRRHRHRRGRRGRAARRPRRRRTLRALPLRGRHAARRVAAHRRRQRPLGVAEGRPPVRAPKPQPVPRSGASRTPHARLRGRLQRGEGVRVDGERRALD